MERKLIGRVGVDSGQLMIIDPCYISNQWREEGKPIGVKFWGEGQKEIAKILAKRNDDVKLKNNAYEVLSNDKYYLYRLRGTIKEISEDIGKVVVSSIITDSTYNRICEITSTNMQAGQIDLGVAFSSGLGDGLYDVYATYKDMGDWGERITKVEIELINEDEE